VKARTLQEWSNFCGMIGTINSIGTILMHEKEPVEKSTQFVKNIFEVTGEYFAVPKELVSDRDEWGIKRYPEKNGGEL